MIQKIDILLWRWAAEQHRNTEGLGYPSKTMEYRLQREGAIIRGTNPADNTPNIRIDHTIMEVNRAINDMRNRWTQVIQARYLGGMGDKDGAEYLGISPSLFRRDLDMAHAWLAGRLNIP